MSRHLLPLGFERIFHPSAKRNWQGSSPWPVAGCALAALFAIALCPAPSSAQVLTIDTSGNGRAMPSGPVDRQYSQIQPTHVDLPKSKLDPKTRLLLIRALMSEQGFAMRPFPRGHKGLTLVANGKLEPAGESYLNMVTSEGLSAKPGSRVVITNIKIDKSRMVFDLNDGPDAKHRFLRHVQIGAGPEMGDPDIDPTIADEAGDPVGSRLTLSFGDRIPELTPAQVKALLAPLISFDVKTPIQAYTDTLPKLLKDAILDHKVLVGMNIDMVLFAKGQPVTKSREMDGQMPIQIWIYGTPPDDVTFVRINGNRVIRVELAQLGEPLKIFTKDVVTPMLMTGGSPVLTAQTNTRTVQEGDVQPDPDKQAPAAPPSLRNPGETLPTDNQNVGVMRPVQFPKPHPDDQPGANPDEQSSQPAQSAQPAQPNTPPSSSQASQPANGQQGSAPSAGANAPVPSSSAQPPAAPAQTRPAASQPPAGSQPPASSQPPSGT